MLETLIGSLYGPLLYAAAALGLVVTVNPQYVYVAGVSVAKDVEERGYSEHESLARLANEIVLVDQRARLVQSSKKLSVLDADSPIQLIGDELHVTPFIRVVQHAAGLANHSISGAITMAGEDEAEFTIRLSRDTGVKTKIVRRAPLKDLSGLFSEMAYETYRYVAPYSFALLELEKALPDRSFEAVSRHVERMLTNGAHLHERAWLHNLRGLIEALEGQEAAAQASFSLAIAESPTPFPLGHLNLGYSRHLAGDDEGAIGEYRKALDLLGVPFSQQNAFTNAISKGARGAAHLYYDIVEFTDRAPRPAFDAHEMIATLLAAWGESEAALKRDECAEALFRMALKRDGSNNLARHAYRVFLTERGRAAEAPPLANVTLNAALARSHEDIPSLIRLGHRLAKAKTN